MVTAETNGPDEPGRADDITPPKPSFFFLGLFLGWSEPFQAFEQLFLGHPIDRNLGVVGVDRAAGCRDQRRRLGLGLVDLHVLLQGVDQLFLEVVARDRDLRTRRDRPRAVACQQHEIETVLDLIDAVLDGNAGHGVIAPAMELMKMWPLRSDLAAKVQGEIRTSHFPWRCGMALLGRSREPPCDPYHCTFGLVVTASVHPQLSGTRSLSPDEPRTRHRAPAAARRLQRPVFEVNEVTREQSWKPKRKKSPCSLTAPTSTPPPSRSVSISITSVSCASFNRAAISCAPSITPR